MVAVDLRATVPKATPTDRRPEVDGYLSEAIYTNSRLMVRSYLDGEPSQLQKCNWPKPWLPPASVR